MATQQQQSSPAEGKKRRLNVFHSDSTDKKTDHLSHELDDKSQRDQAILLPSSETISTNLSIASAPPEILYQTTGEYGSRLIQQYLHKMMSNEEDVLNDSDPEPLHQMRVNGRRLRANIQLLLPTLNIPKKGQINRLKDFHRILGRVRDCDVIHTHLNRDYYPQLPEAEQQLLDVYFGKLKKQRKAYFKQVKAAIYEQTFVPVYQAWLSDPQYLALGKKPIGYLLPGLMLPELIKYHCHAAWDIPVEAVTQEYQAQLHHLRKITKHCRYQLEAAQSLYGETINPWIESLQRVQSILGGLEDLRLLGGILVPDLMPVAYAIWQEHRQNTLTQWEILRNSHCQQSQSDCYIILLQPLQQLEMA
jgi:CHAD domain-containing protein